MFFDSHAHMTCDPVFEKITELIQSAKDEQVEKIINICTDPMTLERGLDIVKQYPLIIYNAAATTPHDVEREGEAVFPLIEKVAKEGKLVAIGETGLDYHYNHSSPEIQRLFLRKYLQLAKEVQLPVIIHCRDAFEDFFQILDEEYCVDEKHLKGVLHCFTGTLEEAQQVIKRGWYLSLSGIMTFKKSEELRQVAKIVPLDKLLIETDTPYLAPQGRRGKENQPAYLPLIADVIAQVREEPVEEIARQTYENACLLFGIPL